MSVKELERLEAQAEEAGAFVNDYRVVGFVFAKEVISGVIAERDALAAKLKDAEHDRDEFRRVMNGFAAKLAELEGQEPVAWIYDWQAPEDLIRDWSTNNAAEIPEGATNIRPLYARQVPAERPVNARLLEALKTLRDALRDHPEYAQLSEEQEEETGGDTAEFSYLVRVADEAIAAAEAQQERLMQDMHDAGREIDRVMAEPAPKEPVAEPVNTRLLTALKACRNKLAHDAEMVAMADVAIMAAEAAPRVARLTADELRLICDRWADEDGATGQTGRTFLARAIETAVLRKNGLALED